MTHAPTVQRSSQRLLLYICSMDSDLQFFARDISQDHVQSETRTQRAIFVGPPKNFNLPLGTLLRVHLPLCGNPEAVIHWFRSYHAHHRYILHHTASLHDPCFLYTPCSISGDRQSAKVARGFTCLQTDETATAGNFAYAKLEAFSSNGFDGKDPGTLKVSGTVTLNGVEILLRDVIYSVTQPEHLQRLVGITEDTVNKSNFVAQLARGAYVAAVWRPDLAFALAYFSQLFNPDANAAKSLNKVILRAKQDVNFGRTFVKISIHTARLAVFADASY